MNKKMITLAALIIAAIPVAYLLYMWPQLPSIVPTHFGLDGKPDDYGSKGELWLLTGILSGMSIGIFFLLTNIYKIDPKKPRNMDGIMSKIGLSVIVIISIIELMIVQSAHSSGIELTRFLLPLLGLFFAFLGNIFYSIKPNYFAGIRTPWALEDENNWRKTHQLAGKLWFTGGLFAMVITLFIPFVAGFVLFMIITFAITIIPIIYSYKLFKRKQLKLND